MDEEKVKKVEVIYEQLLGLFHGLGTPDNDNKISGGSITQYEHAIRELGELTGENLSRFEPETTRNSNGTWYRPKDLKAQSSSLLSFIRAKYLADKQAPHYIQPGSPTTSISQTVNQEVSVMQVVTLDISEILTAKQSEFKEGTKERTFIDTVKSGLRNVQNTAGLLALIAQTAQQCGLTIEQLHKLFT